MLDRKYILFSFLVYFLNTVNAFNLAPVSYLTHSIPADKTLNPDNTYFGYSVVLRENGLVTGAPRANVSVQNIHNPGAVYRCGIKKLDSCERMIINDGGVVFMSYKELFHKQWGIGDYWLSENRTNQYLGATMDGGPKADDPFVVCAPGFGNGNRENHMEGICYWQTNANNNGYENFTLNKLYNFPRSYYVHDYAQVGFSAHVLSNETLVMGAPGGNNWGGTSCYLRNERPRINNVTINNYEYGGYAVSSGHLTGTDEIFIVATAPHGSTVIFDKETNRTYNTRLESAKFGEYFGYSVLVEDFNNDKRDEILIGAPFYVENGNGLDDGIVYLYNTIAKDSNLNKISFTNKTIKSPFRIGTKARFGTTFGKLGDIDLDGYNDVAIGAPFADGIGAVVIYFGSNDGIEFSKMQILKPSSNYFDSMFGFSISRGADIDGNGFNDLAIGAPNSETVFVYRSYPVVHIVMNISSVKHLLPVNEKEFEIKICYGFRTKSNKLDNIQLNLTIDLDTSFERFKLNEKELPNRVVSVVDKCETVWAQLADLKKISFPIPMNLQYKLLNDGRNAIEEFCENCVVSDTSENFYIGHAYFQHECKEVCEVNLQVKAFKVPSSFTYGLNNTITVHYQLSNSGDQAINTKFQIKTNDKNIDVVHVNSSCVVSKSTINCDIKHFEKKTNEIISVIVVYNVSSLSSINELKLTASVSSLEDDKDPNDNWIESVIQVHRVSHLKLTGKPQNNIVDLKDDIETYELEYSLEFLNIGPSSLNEIELSLMLPYQQNTHTFIQYTKAYMQIDSQNFSFTPMEPLTYSQFNETLRSNKLKELNSIKKHYNMSETKTNYLDCQTTERLNCARSKVTIKPVVHSTTISLLLKYELNAKYFFETDIEFWIIALDATFATTEGTLMSNVILDPIIIRQNIDNISIWIYVASVVGGIILLILLIWLLAKKGFFKRLSKKEMEDKCKTMEQDFMEAEIQKTIRESMRRKESEENRNQNENENNEENSENENDENENNEHYAYNEDYGIELN